MERTPLTAKICILTETKAGEKYLLSADNFNEIVNDRYGDCSFVPADDAKVYFASYAGKPINPFAYTDFLSLARHIREIDLSED